MAGCRVTFANLQTLPNPGPLVINTSTTAGVTVVRFDTAIAYGDTDDLDAWTVDASGSPVTINEIQIVAGRIRIIHNNLPQPVTHVTFTGPPPIFRSTTGGILESFDFPVPFP